LFWFAVIHLVVCQNFDRTAILQSAGIDTTGIADDLLLADDL
jgi:hypothetical protein